MPVCTYLSDEQIARFRERIDSELRKLLEEVNGKTGARYEVSPISITTRVGLFRRKQSLRYEILHHVHGPEYQVMNCGADEPDKYGGYGLSLLVPRSAAVAWLYGHLNGWRSANEHDKG